MTIPLIVHDLTIPLPPSHDDDQSGALLERMAQSGADIVSVDWTVSMDEAMRRLGPNIGVQGNLDPAVLMGPHDQVRLEG